MENRNISEKKSKRLVWLTVLAALAVIAVLWPLLNRATEGMVNEITLSISKQYSQELNEQMSAHVSGALSQPFDRLEMLHCSLSMVENLTPEKLTEMIRCFRESNHIAYLSFVDENGTVYEAGGSYLGTTRVKMLGKLLSGQKHLISDNETVGGNSFVLMGSAFDAPVPMGETKLCAAIIGLSNEELTDEIMVNGQYSNGYSSIIHRDGSYIVKNRSVPFSGLNIFSIIAKHYNCTEKDMGALKTAVANGEAYAFSATKSGDDVFSFLYFSPIEDTDWCIVNTMPGTFIKTGIEKLQESTAKLSVLVIAVLIALVIILLQNSSGYALRKKQRELEQAYELAEQANRAKTEFLSSMSHDIRTPMNAILGYSRLMKKELTDPKLLEYQEKIEHSGNLLLSLINNVLDMSHIDSGKTEIREEYVQLTALAASIRDVFGTEAAKKDISLSYTTDIEHDHVFADVTKLNEIYMNIVSNAIKYTPAGGTVSGVMDELPCEKEGYARIRVKIRDTGMGIGKEFLPHIFDSFTRERNTTMAKVAGTGLGLSIVKKLVDLLGGTIDVDSVQGKGSVFTVVLDFKIAEGAEVAPRTEGTGTEAAAFDPNGKRILLAEDNELNAEIAIAILEEMGFTVTHAENGRACVELLQSAAPGEYALILMDIQMPVMNGYEAARAVRALPDKQKARIPIIAMTANAFEEDKRNAIEAGMDAHLAKPIEVKKIEEAIVSLLSKGTATNNANNVNSAN
ncbi:MAG: ATP-binding protein [Clostridia bacterium]|nr:ATP-binding protein [Clostridia bacterium]